MGTSTGSNISSRLRVGAGPRAGSALWILLLLATATLPSRGRGEQTDRILAVVGDRVVTEFDVRMETALTPFLRCTEPPLCQAGQPLLERLIDSAIIRGLAADARVYQPSNEDVERRLALLRSGWVPPEGYPRFLAEFGLSEDDLAGYLYSRMVVEKYVQRNVDVVVTATGGEPADVIAFYEEWIRRQRSQERIRLVEPLP